MRHYPNSASATAKFAPDPSSTPFSSQEQQEIYQEEMENSNDLTTPGGIREYLDSAMYIEQATKEMEKPQITEGEVQRYVTKTKNKTAPGPDGIKNELYKALIMSTEGLKALTRCMEEELKVARKPSSWKSSVTKMIPKQKNPYSKAAEAYSAH